MDFTNHVNTCNHVNQIPPEQDMGPLRVAGRGVRVRERDSSQTNYRISRAWIWLGAHAVFRHQSVDDGQYFFLSHLLQDMWPV